MCVCVCMRVCVHRLDVCVCVCMFMRVCMYEHVAYACCMSVSVRPTLFLPDLDPNQAPVFSALPSDVSVPEDVTPGDTLIQFDVTDTQTFARTLTADSGAALFDFNSASESLFFAIVVVAVIVVFIRYLLFLFEFLLKL